VGEEMSIESEEIEASRGKAEEGPKRIIADSGTDGVLASVRARA
jgi:hypothetical protein